MKTFLPFCSLLLLFFVIASSCEKKAEMPSDGLILYLSFDGKIKDQSIRNLDITDNSSDNFISGKIGKALDFNGTSDYLCYSDSLKFKNGLSFSFWIKSRGVAPGEYNGVMIGKYSMTTNARSFKIYSCGSGTASTDNRLSAAFYRYGYSSAIHDNTKSYLERSELSIYPSDPSLWSIIHPLRLSLNEWTHCVVNLTTTHLEVWVNGLLCTKKQREYSDYYDSFFEPVVIGNDLHGGDGNNNHFNGAIDELRIYNRALTVQEIRLLFYQ
jgi:hypothetical protein